MKVRSVLSNLLFLIGFTSLIFSGFLIVQKFQPQDLAFASAPTKVRTNLLQAPSGLYIPLLSKSLNVYPSNIIDGKWETTDKGVSYLLTSGTPGEVGNAVFYGHNFPSIFGDLDSLNKGSVIIIRAADGMDYKYTVTEKKIVKPTDTDILAQSADSRITVYTCTGFLDSERLVVIATLDR